jgi:hypothetical protein
LLAGARWVGISPRESIAGEGEEQKEGEMAIVSHSLETEKRKQIDKDST